MIIKYYKGHMKEKYILYIPQGIKQRTEIFIRILKERNVQNSNSYNNSKLVIKLAIFNVDNPLAKLLVLKSFSYA